MSGRLVLLAALFSSFLPLASAGFAADALTKGDLSVWCIFDLVYVAIASLCILPIFRLKSHRAPFIALFAATLFSVVQCSLDIGYIVTAQNAPPEKVVAMSSAIVFFSNWSSPVLYLSLWLLLFDRYRQWQSRDSSSRSAWSMDVLLFRSLLGLFAVLMLLSTLSSALYAHQFELQAQLVEMTRVTLQELQHAQDAAQMYLKTSYVFTGFWFSSAVCVTTLSIYVYRSAIRTRIDDKITKVMLFVVTPLYVLGMIESIVFTIYFSPSVNLTTDTQVEDLTLASDLISNFIYACISGVVLGLGLKSEYWHTPDQIVALANLGAAPAGRYLNLEDFPTQK